jgi:benzodiazapine receptor
MNIHPGYKLVISLALPLAVGAVAGIFTATAIGSWFETLHHPSFRPPNWLFGQVWTLLYILMGISLFMVWLEPATINRKKALNIFTIQLLLNFIWSFLFFYFHAIGIALIEIIALWISIVVMIVRFRKVKPVAVYMNIPYLCWVTFALVLNAGYFRLN